MLGNKPFRQRIRTTLYLSSYVNNIRQQDINPSYTITSMRYKQMEVKLVNKEK